MRKKRPSELESGIDRVLDTHTPTRETFILTWGGRTSSQGQTPHPSELCSTPSTRSCALYRGCVTVRRAGPKLVAKRRRQLCKDSAKGCVACSAELAGCLFEPVQSYDHRRSFVATLFGIRAMSRWSLVALAWPPSWGGSVLQSWRAESIAFSMHTHQNATSRLNGARILVRPSTCVAYDDRRHALGWCCHAYPASSTYRRPRSSRKQAACEQWESDR